MNEPKVFDTTTVVAADGVGFGDGGKGDGVAGWLLQNYLYHFESID
jgi:hypothetical protein